MRKIYDTYLKTLQEGVDNQNVPKKNDYYPKKDNYYDGVFTPFQAEPSQPKTTAQPKPTSQSEPRSTYHARPTQESHKNKAFSATDQNLPKTAPKPNVNSMPHHEVYQQMLADIKYAESAFSVQVLNLNDNQVLELLNKHQSTDPEFYNRLFGGQRADRATMRRLQIINLITHSINTGMAAIKNQTPLTEEQNYQMRASSLLLTKLDPKSQTSFFQAFTPDVQQHAQGNSIQEELVSLSSYIHTFCDNADRLRRYNEFHVSSLSFGLSRQPEHAREEVPQQKMSGFGLKN